jgi:hypothetical protein
MIRVPLSGPKGVIRDKLGGEGLPCAKSNLECALH